MKVYEYLKLKASVEMAEKTIAMSEWLQREVERYKREVIPPDVPSGE